jgi:WD40 repeat protein
LAFSPDGRLLAFGSDTTLRLWETATGVELHPSAAHRGGVVALAFLRDGRRLLSAGMRGTAIRWDAGTGRQRGTPRGPQREGDLAAAFSPDGRMMASGTATGIIRVSDLASGQELRRWPGHKGLIYSLAFAPDGRTLASGGADKTLALWGPLTGREVGRFADDQGPSTGREVSRFVEDPGQIVSVAFSPDGRLVAWGCMDGTVGLREAATGKVRHRLRSGAAVFALAFSPDGKTLASATTGLLSARRRGTACLWEVATGRARWQTPVPEGGAYALTFSPDGRTLASGGGDHRVHRWDLAAGRELPPLAGHLGQVTCLAFSPEGTLLASGSMDATALIWKPPPLPPLATPGEASLAPMELEALWDDLAGADAGRAYRAIWTLAGAAGQAVPLLEARLRPAEGKADRHGGEKIPLDPPAAAPHPEWLRVLRALEVLERIRTPQAYRLVRALAAGAPAARVTEEARAALGRLDRRRDAAP